ncbi:MAG: hypothetical protein LBV74_09435 [Tannerella sp.]|jgi:hypothetical protein|nr:hypothetical protein [Tannerella sp.]
MAVERDYLMRMLQEFFEAIAKIVHRDSPGMEPDVSDKQERFNDMYKQYFRSSADYFYETEKEIILDDLEEEGLREEDLFAKMQMLSELLYQDALIKRGIPEKCMLLEKALFLFEYMNKNGRTYSWDREQKISDIKKQLTEFDS